MKMSINSTIKGKINGTGSCHRGGKMSKIAVQQVGNSQAAVFGFKLTGIRANETRLTPAYVYDRHRKEFCHACTC